MNHPTYDSGGLKATPGCPCEYCRAVFDDWGKQAEGFQRWYNALTQAQALNYFGEVRDES